MKTNDKLKSPRASVNGAIWAGLILMAAILAGVQTSQAQDWKNALLEEEDGNEMRFWTTGEGGGGGYRIYGSGGGREGTWEPLGGNDAQGAYKLTSLGTSQTVIIKQVGNMVIMDYPDSSSARKEEYRILKKGEKWEEAAKPMISWKMGLPDFELEDLTLEKTSNSKDTVTFKFTGKAKARDGLRTTPVQWEELPIRKEVNELLARLGEGWNWINGRFFENQTRQKFDLPVETSDFTYWEKDEYIQMGIWKPLGAPGTSINYTLGIPDKTNTDSFTFSGQGEVVRYGGGWTSGGIKIKADDEKRYNNYWRRRSEPRLSMDAPEVKEVERAFLDALRDHVEKTPKKTELSSNNRPSPTPPRQEVFFADIMSGQNQPSHTPTLPQAQDPEAISSMYKSGMKQQADAIVQELWEKAEPLNVAILQAVNQDDTTRVKELLSQLATTYPAAPQTLLWAISKANQNGAPDIAAKLLDLLMQYPISDAERQEIQNTYNQLNQ